MGALYLSRAMICLLRNRPGALSGQLVFFSQRKLLLMAVKKVKVGMSFY
jgi:hypothetical protein